MSFEEQCELLDRLFAAIPAGDVEAVRDLYSPAVEVWHNFDGRNQAAGENLATLRWVSRNVAALRYEDVRRAALADGRVLQQHVLRGTAPNGAELAVPAAIVFTLVAGRITRLEEYLDTAQVAALRA